MINQTNPAGYAAFEQQAKQGSPPPTEGATRPSAPLAMPARSGNIIQNPEILLNESLENRYRIDAVLDKTGLAAVFKAHDTKFQRDVAIKIIDLTQVEQPAIKERVRQEVQTAMKLDNPGVVKIYDFGQAKDLLYIIMEFIPGQNLREAMQRFGLLNLQTVLPEILHLVRQICLTLGYMHQQGVLHPGVKPGNIMLKPDPTEQDG
ncbi:MAG: serine/threonine protein kinase, partial [Anaerolineae bacterium]|nr:serine/threonine protein kinase [Anaerolineae bacterium]